MAHFEGNFRPVSDVYDLNSDEREFRASADILNDFGLAVFSTRLATAMHNAGLKKAKTRRVNGIHTRGWFVPPKLSPAVVNASGETPATPAPPIQPTTLAQLPMELAQPDAVDMPETAYSDASATQSVGLYERTDQPQEASEDALSASDKIAGDTHSGIDAILAAVNTPIVAEGFDLTKRPPGIRMIEASAEAFAPTHMPLWVEARLLLNVFPRVIYLYPDDGVKDKAGKPRAKQACVGWGKPKLTDTGADVVDAFFDGKPYHGDYTMPQRDGKANRHENQYFYPDGSVVTKFTFDKSDCNIAVATGEGVVVLDVDVKGGKDGLKVIESLGKTLGCKLPKTLTVKTPSGGYHFYFKVPKSVRFKNLADILPEHGKGLDIRSDGGYVVAPPSTINGVPYTYAESIPVADLPQVWIDALPKQETANHDLSVPSNGSCTNTRELKPIDQELRGILAQTKNDMPQTEWFDVLSVCSGYEGGRELAYEWSKGGEFAQTGKPQLTDETFTDVWENRIHGDWNRDKPGTPKGMGVLVNIAKEHNRNPSGYCAPLAAEHAASAPVEIAGLGAVPNGVKAVAGSEEAFANTAELAELPSVQSLLDSITTKAAKSQGAWLAHAVLSADEERVKAYQRDNPTTSTGAPRKLLANDGSVEWSAATYTAAMHIAGEALILQANHSISAVSELNQEDARKVTTLVHDLFKACPIAHVWAAIPTTKNDNMHNIIVQAVWKARIQRQGEALSNNPAVGNTPAVQPAPPAPPVHSGFDLNKPPSSLTGRVEAVAPVAPAQPPVYAGFDLSRPPDSLTGKANGVVSSGVLSPAATGITAVPVQVGEMVPVTIGSVASLPPKRARDGKRSPLESLKTTMLEAKKGVWFTCKTTREIYTLTEGGWYEHVPGDDAKTEVANIKELVGIDINTMKTVEDTVRLLQMILPKVEFCMEPHLIPMQNGVLDSETRQLHAYNTMLPFNWHIPHDYTDDESCEVWHGFIAKQFGGDEGRSKTLQAFMRCMLGGAYQAQKYLEVVGTGDAGKSQLMKVCIALMGEANTVTSSLAILDGGREGGNQYETRNFLGKKLIVMPDQSKFYGESSNFRCITGNDPIRNEEKHVQAGGCFVFQGFVIITANQFMNPRNNGGAILRRRVPILLDVAATNAEKARYPQGIGQYIIDHELAGVLNWVLAMPLDEAREQLRTPDGFTARLNEQVEDGNNPVRAWLRDEVVSCERGGETLLGSDIRDHAAVNSPEWGMYASYCDYCRGAGNVPMNRKSFVDMVLNEVRGKGVEHTKETLRNHNRNKWILSGLRLRKDSDD